MTPSQVTRLEKTAVDNGFDRELPQQDDWLAFASTQAPLRIWMTAVDDDRLVVAVSQANVARALADQGAEFDAMLPQGAQVAFIVPTASELHHLVRRAFQLSRTLPDELLHVFEQQTAGLPRATEAERLVIERVGQNVFRAGLLEYWEGRCAVTGLGVTSLLRASHIKPWAACATDSERLDIFNGLLLAPNLDAAFDGGFISVADDGSVLTSDQVDTGNRGLLGISSGLRVTHLEDGHRAFLRYHREHVFRSVGTETMEAPRFRSAARNVRPAFERYIGIDYSGAETPCSNLPGLRVYAAEGNAAPLEVRPRRNGHWSRKDLAVWLVEQLGGGPSTLVGIDHCFSLPREYFDRHALPHDWPAFLDDFQSHWPTDGDTVYVDFVREGIVGTGGTARTGDTRWRRVTDRRAGAAKSPFHFDVPGSVAKSTHSGLPWLRYMRSALAERVHFWPYDGWTISEGRSAIVEVYPSLWRGTYPGEQRSQDQHDAFSATTWLQSADLEGSLSRFLQPSLTDADRQSAGFEGWILGVP